MGYDQLHIICLEAAMRPIDETSEPTKIHDTNSCPFALSLLSFGLLLCLGVTKSISEKQLDPLTRRFENLVKMCCKHLTFDLYLHCIFFCQNKAVVPMVPLPPQSCPIIYIP